MLEAESRIFEHVKGRIMLYIPTDIWKDSQFPFKIGERVKLRIEGKRLVVEKLGRK